MTVAAPEHLDSARRGARTVRRRTVRDRADALRAVAPVRSGTSLLEVMRALDAAGVEAIDVNRREATLDDVFLTLTGSQHSETQEVHA